MLSRLLFNAGRSALSQDAPVCLRIVYAQRYSSSAVTAQEQADQSVAVANKYKYPERLQDWENFKMPGAPYEGMGPRPPLPDFDKSLTRHYIIPEYWFQFLYPRTGATGLYTLFATFGAMLVSKEYYVYTPETWHAVGLICAVAFVLKQAGPMIADVFEDTRVNMIKAYEQIKDEEVVHMQTMVDDIKLEQWRAGAQLLINDAKKVNLAMMLDTEYMNRQTAVTEAVKRKLDYQVDLQKIDSELAHGHMVKWIEEKVMATITPESQKATLSACIAQLNTIGSK